MFGHDHNNPDENEQNHQAPEPVDDGTLGVPNPDGPSMTPPSDNPAPMAPPPVQGMPTNLPQPTTAGVHTSDDLLSIKQDALQQLKPLVGHLDQSPEEKFRTTMMMIQAADDQSLLGNAYDAAKSITDEKMRAQALLDVVNEINYFTSQNNQKEN